MKLALKGTEFKGSVAVTATGNRAVMATHENKRLNEPFCLQRRQSSCLGITEIIHNIKRGISRVDGACYSLSPSSSGSLMMPLNHFNIFFLLHFCFELALIGYANPPTFPSACSLIT
jgi:hypothetical protein